MSKEDVDPCQGGLEGGRRVYQLIPEGWIQTSDCRCKIMNKFVCLCVLHLKPSSFSSFSITFLCIFLSNIALAVI